MARQERSQTTADSVSRRDFVAQTSALTAAAISAGSSIAVESLDSSDETSTNRTAGQQHAFLTTADEFRDVSRGNPKPYTRQGGELTSARLTNDYRANDTYALKNNDPESHLKTAAYIDTVPKQVTTGKPLVVSGLVMSGLSGVERVETWLHRFATRSGPRER